MNGTQPITAYPLSWPAGWKRTKSGNQQDAKFGKKVSSSTSSYARSTRLTLHDGLQRVLVELDRMGIDMRRVVISTNIVTRKDGFPRSGQREPVDAGAAIYWQEQDGTPRVMAIDQYRRVADNLAAIGATLDALRAVERHGGAAILERAFTGFTAIAAPAAEKTWRDVFEYAPGAKVALAELNLRFRQMASKRHPDKQGGSHDAMVELNRAYDQAAAEIGL